jgi:hypothetical protein
MINVLTISKDDSLFESYCEKIKEFCGDIQDIKLLKNYKKDLKIEDSIAISTFENEGQILGFSTVLHRPIFNNGVRILNRFYKDKTYRFINNRREVSRETKEMIEQQLEVAKSLEFDFAFMSRESNITPPAFKYYSKYLNFANWHVEDKKYKVCHGDISCDQFIIWTPIKSNATLSLTLSKG